MKRTKKGFTLIELVVVIAVLAVLAAIAIPVVSGIIDDANESVDGANAKAIESAIKIYTVQNNKSTIDSANAATALIAADLNAVVAKKSAAAAFVIDGSDLTVTVSDTTPSSGIIVGTTDDPISDIYFVA